MPWNLSLSDLMNQMANSAASALMVQITSLSAGALAVSAGGVDAFAVCAHGGGALPISAPSMIEVDVYPAETIGVSCSDSLPISTGGTIGISASLAQTWGVSAVDLDVDIPDTIGMSTTDTIPVSTAGFEVGISAYGTIDSGMTSAVAASTAYSLPDIACKSVAVKADDDNSNIIYIGASDVAGDGANGYRLNAGQGISLQLDNVNRVYFTADTAAEKIYWLVINT